MPLPEKIPIPLVNLWNHTKTRSRRVFIADVLNTVKYIQMSSASCPTRKCDEKKYQNDSFASAHFWGYSQSSQSASAKAIWGNSKNFTPQAPKDPESDERTRESVRIWGNPERERESSATFQLHQCQINKQHNLGGGHKPVLNANRGYNTTPHTQDGSWRMFIL